MARAAAVIGLLLAATPAAAQRMILCDVNLNNCSAVKNSAPGATDYGLVVRVAGSATADGAIQDGVTASIEATVRDYANSNPLGVALTDSNGDVYSAAAPTQYAEDTTSAAGDLVNMAGVVRNDVRGTLVNLDNERTQLQVNASGDLRVDGSAVTQPVSGTVTVTDGAGALNVIVDSGTLTAVTAITNAVTVTDGAGALNVIIDSGALAQLPAALAAGGGLKIEGVAGGVVVPVSAASLPLPTGASTSALQGGGLPAALAAGGGLKIEGVAGGVVVPVSGTVTVTDGAGALNVIVDSSATVTVTDGAGAMNTIVDSGVLTSVTDITNAIKAVGNVAHDAAGTGSAPLLTGGYSSAAAPVDVDADGDAVRAWHLRNGAQAVNVTAAGALIAGDATNGLDVDVTRLSALVTGSAIVGRVGIDQTTPGTTNLVQVTDGAGALNVIVDSSATVTVTDGAGAMNTIIDSGTVTTVSTVTAVTDITNAVKVIGPAADGVAVSGAPVRLGGKDGGGLTQDLITDATGNLSVGTGTAGSAASNVVTVQGIASGTTLIVGDGSGAMNTIIDSGTVTAVTAITNALPVGANVIGKVSIDQATPGTTNLVQVTDGSGALNTIIDSGTVTTVSTVTSVTNVAGIVGVGSTGSAPPATANAIAGIGSGATLGLLTGITVCDSEVAVNISTITTTLIVTGVAGRHVRICAINLVTAAANNVAFINGTGATCGTSTAGMNGGTTAASGWNLVANGGIAQGMGIGEIMSTNNVGGATGDSVCIVTSATTQLSGVLKYAIY